MDGNTKSMELVINWLMSQGGILLYEMSTKCEEQTLKAQLPSSCAPTAVYHNAHFLRDGLKSQKYPQIKN